MKGTSLQRRIQYIAESVIKDMLNENLGTNQKKARNAYLFYKFGEASSYTDAQKTEAFNFINHKQISKEIPNALADDMFFACGAVRLLFDEEIEPKEVNNIIKFALQNKSKFDRDLNGLSYDEFKKELEGNSNAQTSTDTPSKKHKYIVKVARTFEESKSICKDIPDCDWCIGRDSWAFKKYVGGKGCFVFLIRDDYKDVKQVSGDNSPLDDYGTSAFAVSFAPKKLSLEGSKLVRSPGGGEINTITCRWNHANGGDDSVCTVEELNKITGINVKKYLPNENSEVILDCNNLQETVDCREIVLRKINRFGMFDLSSLISDLSYTLCQMYPDVKKELEEEEEDYDGKDVLYNILKEYPFKMGDFLSLFEQDENGFYLIDGYAFYIEGEGRAIRIDQLYPDKEWLCYSPFYERFYFKIDGGDIHELILYDGGYSYDRKEAKDYFDSDKGQNSVYDDYIKLLSRGGIAVLIHKESNIDNFCHAKLNDCASFGDFDKKQFEIYMDKIKATKDIYDKINLFCSFNKRYTLMEK